MFYAVLQECGADCAKFQKSELEFKFNRKALERPYTSKHSWGKTYGEHKRHLEFSHAQYKELQSYAQEIGIFFTASGMDEVRSGPPHGGWRVRGTQAALCLLAAPALILLYCVQLSGKPADPRPRGGPLREGCHSLKTQLPIRAATLDPRVLHTVEVV